MNHINVIDLFAGPGGLGEGFSAYQKHHQGASTKFKIRLSIEMDKFAHETLMLRSFFRQFEGGAPAEYYDYYRGDISLDELKNSPSLRNAWRAAEEEVGEIPLRMGEEESDNLIEGRISELLKDSTSQDKWMVIGGPPCQAFSRVGRVRNMAKPDYRQSEDDRIYAYIEYLKILHQVQPDCFVLENVEGMLQTSPDGEPIFPTIYNQLKNPSDALKEMGHSSRRLKSQRESNEYAILPATGEVRDSLDDGSEFLVPISEYGVPQDRRRVILIGVRKDIFNRLKRNGRYPSLEKFESGKAGLNDISLDQVIGDLPKIRSKISTRNFFGSKTKEGTRRRLNTIDCFMNGFLSHHGQKESETKSAPQSSLALPLELPRATAIPAKSKSGARLRAEFVAYRESLLAARKAGRLPRDSDALWLKMMEKIVSLTAEWSDQLPPEALQVNNASISEIGNGLFHKYQGRFKGPTHLKRWLMDPALGGVRNHESREHKASDLLRYFYYAVTTHSSPADSAAPKLASIPDILQPDHKNADSGHFVDRFRVQPREKLAKTITCHLGKDGHAFIHYDAAQCRALSVREAARIQTFPDNYVFCGPVSEQRKQVGNAVPPWFALQLADLVSKLLD